MNEPPKPQPTKATHNKKVTLTTLSLLALIAFTGCTTSNTNPTPTPPSETGVTTELGNTTLSNLDALASRAVLILDDYDFRNTIRTFLDSGEKPKGYNEKFENLSSLVSHDEVWVSEKAKIIQMSNDGKLPVNSKDAGLYLDAITVTAILQPAYLDEIDSIPSYNFDISAFNSVDDNGEISWSKSGGISIGDSNKITYSVLTPNSQQYFANNGLLLSARNMTEQLNQPLTKPEAEEHLRSLNSQISTWITSAGLQTDDPTSIEQVAPEILNNLTIPKDFTSTDEPAISITGTIGDYQFSIVDGENTYSIRRSGKMVIPESLPDKTGIDLPFSDLKTGWDAYNARKKSTENDSNGQETRKLVDSLNEEITDKPYTAEKVDDYYHVAFTKNGVTTVFA